VKVDLMVDFFLKKSMEKDGRRIGIDALAFIF
jgi:hypothetical protein